MQFFFTPDTCSLASLIVLHDVGAPFDLQFIDFRKDQQKSDAFRKVNPKLRVPALVSDDWVLTETPAILVYLAQAYPEANLIPDDISELAQIQSFNAYICSTLHVAHAHRMRGSRWVDGKEHEEAMRAKVPQAVGDCYAYLEEHSFEGPFVFGDTYTVADPYLFTVAQWMESDGVDPDRFPKIRDHWAMMKTRPAVAKSLEIEEQYKGNPG